MNNLLLSRLALLTDSPNYLGDRSRGVRVGSSRGTEGLGQLSGDNVRMADGLDDNNDNDEELGVDEMDEQVGQLVDYVSELALLP